MKLKTKLGILFACCLLLTCGKTFADNCCTTSYEPSCGDCGLYPGGFWVGMNYSTYSGDDWAVMAGWYTECLLIDLGYNYESIKVDQPRSSFHLHELRGHLGLRYRLCYSNLFGTVGAAFSYGFRSVHTPTRCDPYEIGAFVGLDYQFSRHFFISGKIAPYMYERSYNRNTNNRAFAEGSFTVGYIF